MLLRSAVAVIAVLGVTTWTPANVYGQASSGAPLGRVIHQKLSAPPIAEGFDTDRLIVKFHPKFGVRKIGGAFSASAGTDLSSLQSIILTRPDMQVSKALLESDARLTDEKSTLQAQYGREMPDLSSYYVFQRYGASLSDATSLFHAVNALEIVEVAYFAAKGAPPPTDIPPTTPNIEGQQGYLSASAINAYFGWNVPGGTGVNIKFVDIEYSWRLTHEDFKAPFLAYTVANPAYPPWHGNGVLGELIAQRNGYGVTGIVPDAQFGVVAQEYYGNDEVGFANAIALAKSSLVAGDLLLLEAQWSPPASCIGIPGTYVPVETQPLIFDQIVLTVAQGITVVEPAANGARDLDNGCFGNIFNRSYRDSGAILVGAGTSAQRAPLPFTNYGSRVDLQGWGENVVTTTTNGQGCLIPFGGSTDLDQQYTSCFSGTSSASPIVAGAAISLQGVQRAHNGMVLRPSDLRRVLKERGTPQSADPRLIGPLPNLQAAISWLLVDLDQDGMSNGDELTVGRSPYIDERLLPIILGDD